ncbi:hypothetical protein N7519_006213 [Penicillium mononematosum]|uniref:uncharacterized protein n=1 Tax=Penicillium mononematosum TaxID=268346 RepID=UPI00254747C4|nr:uncharacterized protein N7519_006213 [Penicillium mononematosum]KAJ6184912.1 hypothetical protein N7519_006213 [Penicillium mononematosum]
MSASTPQSIPQSSTSPWIILAITSGAFAALNGVFAKLTTDNHTTAFAQSLAHLFGLDSSPVIEMLTRGPEPKYYPSTTTYMYNCLSWSKRPLQRNNVGAFHTRANSRPVDGQSLHHEYGVELLGDGAVWDDCFSGGCWRALVVGGCDDGGWVYFGWDARGGLAFG